MATPLRWVTPCGRRVCEEGPRAWMSHRSLVSLPPPTASTWPWDALTREQGLLAPSSKEGEAGAYCIYDSSFLTDFVYISFLRFHLNKILVNTERSPRNCIIVIMLSCDRCGA